MNNAAVLFFEDGIEDSYYFHEKIYIPEYLNKLLKNSNKIHSIYFSLPSGYSGKITEMPKDSLFFRNSADDISCWKNIFQKSKCVNIIKIYADSYFLDINIINEMLALHLDYIAEYTFSENLPAGYNCDIFSDKLISSIPDAGEQRLPLNKVVKTNINQFDVEIYYCEPDIRNKRTDFRMITPRSRKVMENILAINKTIPEYKDILKIINDDPSILYVAPSYIEIELTGKYDSVPIYSHRKASTFEHNNIDIVLFKNIIDSADKFGLPYSVCFGGLGDPLYHPNFYELLDYSLQSKLVENLVIETDGTLIDDNFSSFINTKNDSRIKIIISVNGFDKDSYKTIHNADDFDKVNSNIDKLLSTGNHASSIFVQIYKIKQTESFLDKYYDYWEAKKTGIILQKQNVYLGKVTDLRYSDLSPVLRIPCWHLERDMYILSNGQVAFCKQDFDGRFSNWNLSSSSMQIIWNERAINYVNNCGESYPESPDCAICDEWYTFNL